MRGRAHVVLLIQHARPMRYTVLSRASSLAPPYFSTCHKQHDFREKVTERKMCVLISSTNFVQNIYHSKKNSERYCHKCEKRLHVKYSLIL